MGYHCVYKASAMAQNIVAASETSTGINTQLLHHKVSQGAGFAGANVVDDQNATFAQNVRALLGDKVDLRYLMNSKSRFCLIVGFDKSEVPKHSDTGLCLWCSGSNDFLQWTQS